MARYRYFMVVQDLQGNAISGASVSVYIHGTSNGATVYDSYDDPTGNSTPPQTSSGPDGKVEFWLDSSDYSSPTFFDITITYDSQQAQLVNVPIIAWTAEKLATARQISLIGDASGLTSFDGSQDVSITTTVNQASKLSTARQISLTGDASGSTSFDGSQDVSISVSVSNSDKTDGYHASQTPAANTIPVSGSNGKLDANWLPITGYWEGSGNDIYNTNTGNVGIGISSPSAKLTVSGDVKFGFVDNTTWGLSGYSYRKKIIIDNTQNSSALTDYQVLVTVNTKELIDAGRMQSNGNDIRFTDSDGSTNLYYWIESGINTVSTRIWVKVPSIPASSTKTIYMYYGNPSASSASSGDNVFLFFDDFSSGNLNKWTNLSGTWSVTTATLPDGTSGYVARNGDASGAQRSIRSASSIGSDNLIIEGYINITNVNYSGALCLRLSDGSNFYFSGFSFGNHFLSIAKNVSGTISELTFTGSAATGWKFLHFRISGTNLYAKTGSVELSATDTSLSSGNYVGLYTYGGGNTVYWWQIRVRKYTSIEPYISISGLEQNSSDRIETVFYVDSNTKTGYLAGSVLSASNASKWDGSAKYVSTSDPSGGNDGDMWFKYV
jgi:hypothetical protein